jgi:MFS family permease
VVVLADVASFVAAATLVGGMARQRPVSRLGDERAGDGRRPGAARRFWEEWRDGLDLVRVERTIGGLFVALGLMTFGGTMLDPLTAAWVRDVLGGSATAYAALMVAHAVSGIVGAVVVGSWGHRLSPRLLTAWASVVAAALLLVKFHVPVLEVAVGISLVQGFVAVASGIGVEALAQERVPAGYRGRVFGLLQATIWALSLLGALVGGLVAELVGLLPALDLAVLLTGTAGVVLLVVLPARARVPGSGHLPP